MGEFVTLSEADVEIFRRIPRRTHKLRVFQSFPESFTGKEAITFLKTAFDIKSDEEAHRWASLLMQANVIKNANYRYAKSFDSRSKFIYVLGPIEEQNLFWLDLDSYTKDEPNILERRMSVVDHADPSELVGLKEVPEMPALPFIGNAFDVAGPLDTHRSMCILGREICQKYDGIFKISLMGHEFIVVSDPEIVQTIFESPHFGKNTENDAIFKELRTFRGEGLTTVSDGPLHDQCQGVVAPKLVKSCFARYVPIIAETMNQCFREELGTSKNDVDFRWFWKKCTLRSVGKIAMGIDLYEGKKWKSFIENLTFVADEAINRVFKGTNLIPIFNYKFKKAVKSMQKKLLKVVQERREQHLLHGKNEDKYDLLDVMLTTPLRKDGKGNEVFMNDELIRANLVTILSAGHSTTTCMLSWSCNYLYDVSLGNSDYRYALIQEIASISNGDRRYIPTVEDVYKKMNMMTCILNESLRLSPPIPTIVRHAFQSTNLHGYRIKKGDTLMISCLGTHLNPKSWSDPLTFNPLRFERDVPHPCSFIPWAGGPRQCIGREFALLTGRIGLFLLMNQYSLELSPNARVREDEHLFVFPEGLFMNAVIRKDMIKRVGERKSSTNATRSESTGPASEPGSPGPSDGERAWDGLKALIRESGHQVTILSGTKSQVGNTNTIAQMCLRKALDFNFKTGDSPIAPDNYFPDISPPTKFSIVAVCVATYNGNPPPNTKQAYEWLKSMVTRLENGEQKLASYLTNIHYFVFGCGNKNWATTFNKIGKFFDENLVKLGAKRMCPAGFFDESSDDIEEVFSEFYKVMAPKLMHSLPEIGDKRLRAVDASSIQKSIKSSPSVSAQPASSAFQLDILGDAEDIGMPPIIPSSTHSKVFSCTIRTILDITPKAERSTLHIEFNLEENMKYRAGDHLVVCPVIPDEIVYRVINRFVDYDESTVLRWSPQVRVTSTNQFPLPVSTPMTVGNIFRNLVDLKAQPSKQFLINYSTIVEDPAHEQELKQIVQSISAYKAWLSSNIPISNYQIIEQYPPRLTELGRLIEILPILKPRPYSISSSPNLVNNQVHLCVGVVEDEYKEKNQTYQGTCSYYLKTLIANPETPVNVFVEPADEKFDCPKDDNIPMIMVSAGTGFAPMRSFLQERKARRAKGEIYVFFGCRNENTDWIYSAELLEYQREGFITGMWVGYSRSSNHPRQYVQDKILEQSELVWKALDDKAAYIYVCGSGTRVGVGTRDALLKIIAEQSNKGEDFASEYINQLQQDGRYEQDVWG